MVRLGFLTEPAAAQLVPGVRFPVRVTDMYEDDTVTITVLYEYMTDNTNYGVAVIKRRIPMNDYIMLPLHHAGDV